MSETGDLGKLYHDSEVIIQQGEVGNCMYVIQDGQVEILLEDGDKQVRLAVKGRGEIIGEMALFDREVRSATVRAVGQARLLTVDKKNFLRRVSSDPSLALRVTETMSQRIRDLNAEVARLKNELLGK